MGFLKHRRPVLTPPDTQSSIGGSAKYAFPEYIAIKHSSADDDITLTGSDATYAWTGVNFQSTPANFTLNASDELKFNIGGKFEIDYTLMFASSGGTVFPFWTFAQVEIDEGTTGAWSSVTGSFSGTSMEFDPGGGQTKISNTTKVITSVAAGDSLRIRVRRGAGAATTVKSDGSLGSNWNIIKIAD
jgi:hypothetical protein